MNSIQTLVQEHDHILRMLDVVHNASLSILAGNPVEVTDMKAMVSFIRSYADQLHHGKEEHFLFHAMIDELGGMGENLIRHGMLVEHDLGRLYVSDLDAALDAYAQQPSTRVKLAILVAAGSYEMLLRRHIQKENDVVFPFGERQLSAKSLAWVEGESRAFEARQDNSAMRETQLATLVALEAKYPSSPESQQGR